MKRINNRIWLQISRQNESALIIILFLVFFLIISSVAILNGAIHIRGDSIGYYQLAKNIAAGNGFSRCDSKPYIPDSIRTPIYPLFIAVFFVLPEKYLCIFVIMVQCIFAALTVLFLKKTLDLLSTTDNILKISGIIFFGISPNFIVRIFSLYTEILFLFIFSLILYFLVKFITTYKKNSCYPSITIPILLGALLGIFTLIRPMPQYLFLLICGIFIFKKKFILSVLVALSFILAVSPWVTRNYFIYKKIAISSAGYVNLYFHGVTFLLDNEELAKYQKKVSPLLSDTSHEITLASTGYMDFEHADRMKKISLLVIRDNWPKYSIKIMQNLLDFPIERGANIITEIFNIDSKRFTNIPWKDKITKFEFIGIMAGAFYELLYRVLFYSLVVLGIVQTIKFPNEKEKKSAYFLLLLISFYFIFLQSAVMLNDFDLSRILLTANLSLSVFIPLGLKKIKNFFSSRTDKIC